MHLIQDESFDYELIRVMAHTTYRGSDTLEVIQLLSKIKPGDMESWYEAFFDLAQRVEASVGSAPSAPSPSRAVSRADRLFAASNYYRAADFFLHGNGEDPRITSIWKKQTECYDLALQALGNGQRFTLDADEFNVPIIYFKASAHSKEPCPTIIVGNGYDGAMEEMLHVNGFAALERGYNVILYEGPGQPTVRREQDLGFIPDWERVVKPVVDFAVEQPEVNTKKIALFGYSFGGILSVRAAAFEHRLAAAIAVDGLFNFAPPMPGHVSALYRDGDREAFDETLASMATNPKVPTGLRWGIEQGKHMGMFPPVNVLKDCTQVCGHSSRQPRPTSWIKQQLST